MMSNTKVVAGVAAGVAALAVVGIVLKKKGHLDGLSAKADELGSDIKERFISVKESARKRFDEIAQKGRETTEVAPKAIKTDA